MDLDTGAGLLHRLTSYEPGREWDVPADDPQVRHDLVPNDPQTLPPPVKGYPDGLLVVALPRDLPDPGVPATAVLAGVPAPAQPLDLAQLGRLLFLGAGVVRTTERSGRRILFRAAGSAGARFPLEVYASTRDVAGVPDGVHWGDPVGHALVQIAPAALGVVTTLIVTGVPWRTGWRYAERGWRHLYWDAGTLVSQLAAAADSAGLAPQLRTLFPDGQVRELVGADGVQVPHWVVVHGVEGVLPGLYRWPDLATPRLAADLREELLRICLDQGLAADCAYLVVGAAPLSTLDDRSYREAQLAAGLVEGRLHLAAYALGVGATGMTFLDSEMPSLLGESNDLAALLITCVGVPEYTSRAGGGPGAPVEVRYVTPRLGSS